LALFGPSYRYLIFGYPPFLKSWLDKTSLDLSAYRIDAVVGGEGMSESLRTHLRKHFGTVVSSYGASDLEINIGVETELTIALRRLCLEDAALSSDLFGNPNPPMLFQYNAADYVIERSEDGELLFTIVRLEGASPKIRYNLRDLGGTYTHRDIADKLSQHGRSISDLAIRQSAFPILYVHGRGDLSVPFYGCKVFPSDIEDAINTHPALIGNINSFRIQNLEDENLKRTLLIHLERSKNVGPDFPGTLDLSEILFTELCRINQDFREVTKMFDKSCVAVELHDFESGVFAGRDIRIKNKYIA